MWTAHTSWLIAPAVTSICTLPPSGGVNSLLLRWCQCYTSQCVLSLLWFVYRFQESLFTITNEFNEISCIICVVICCRMYLFGCPMEFRNQSIENYFIIFKVNFLFTVSCPVSDFLTFVSVSTFERFRFSVWKADWWFIFQSKRFALHGSSL